MTDEEGKTKGKIEDGLGLKNDSKDKEKEERLGKDYDQKKKEKDK